MSKNFGEIGLQVPQVWLPRPGIDLKRWAVVACDQYTTQPEYWKQVEHFVGNAPSTLHLVFPEVYLGETNAGERIQQIQARMVDYLSKGILMAYDGLVYVERIVDHKTRRGLLACLDLEKYDYLPGSRSLVRATEGTIVERLPARMRIRENAPLELPHVLILVDDPEHTVIEGLSCIKADLKPLYDFELMQSGGRLRGWLVDDSTVQDKIYQALLFLMSAETMQEKYGQAPGSEPLLFAVGDGNHSLASAKAVWENIKLQVESDHPARFALVEIVNVHDPALVFEPIHRVLFNVRVALLTALWDYFGNKFIYESQGMASSWEGMVALINQKNTGQRDEHCFGLVMSGECGVVRISGPQTNLVVATLQEFLDHFLQQECAEKIDYVHGDEVLRELAGHAGNAGFYLPAMLKNELFKTVILEGALPRKSFSMGEAQEKRFYMESRRIYR